MKADAPKQYRLVELRAENFKKLKAVSVKFDGSILKVNGRNGQGKSSLLDAVAAAIGGKDAFPAEPVRKGQDKAEIFLDFGGLKLTRKIWNKDGGGVEHVLVLEYADGKRPKDKQGVLDKLRGSPIADDPIEFSRLKPKDRYELMKSLVPDFDFEDTAQRRKDMFEERTQVGRDYEKAKAAAASIIVPEGTPDTLVDVTTLARQLTDAIDHNARVKAEELRREDFADALEAKRDRADRMAAELKALREDIQRDEDALATISAAKPLPSTINTETIREQISSASSINAAVRRWLDKISLQAEADTYERNYAVLSAKIEELDKAKAAAIENAKFPVEGLEFGDDDIMLDGLPFSDASTARKIAVSTALLMALKPELRVLLVREGSLLDEDARAALEEAAKANDFVVLMECVGAGDGTGIVIENGEVI